LTILVFAIFVMRLLGAHGYQQSTNNISLSTQINRFRKADQAVHVGNPYLLHFPQQNHHVLWSRRDGLDFQALLFRFPSPHTYDLTSRSVESRVHFERVKFLLIKTPSKVVAPAKF
jgi:hypothetical protein